MILYAGLNEIGLTTNLHVPDYHLGHEISHRSSTRSSSSSPTRRLSSPAMPEPTAVMLSPTRSNIGLILLVTDHVGKSHAHILVN